MANVPLILASASAARRRLLSDAGIPFEAMAPRLDEAALKAALARAGATPANMADALAEAKAVKLSARRPEALVLGADQVLVCEGRVHDKPMDRAAARAQLRILSGRTHRLVCAAVIAAAGRPVWRHAETARLHVRPLSDAFIEAYLDQEGKKLLGCLGAYRLEGMGVQIFEKIEGDHFAILGLPLLAVIAYLRTRAMVPA